MVVLRLQVFEVLGVETLQFRFLDSLEAESMFLLRIGRDDTAEEAPDKARLARQRPQAGHVDTMVQPKASPFRPMSSG
jgi:hypothetical protein